MRASVRITRLLLADHESIRLTVTGNRQTGAGIMNLAPTKRVPRRAGRHRLRIRLDWQDERLFFYAWTTLAVSHHRLWTNRHKSKMGMLAEAANQTTVENLLFPRK